MYYHYLDKQNVRQRVRSMLPWIIAIVLVVVVLTHLEDIFMLMYDLSTPLIRFMP